MKQTLPVPRTSLASGLLHVGATRWIAQIISWASTVWLARILSPTDYGLVAVALTAITWLAALSDRGLTNAITSGPLLSARTYRALFTQSLCLGVFCTVLLFVAAVPIARFFGDPRILPLTIVLGGCLLLDTARVVPAARLARTLRNRDLARFELVRNLLQTSSVVFLAFCGMAYWSLVLGQLAGSAVHTLQVLRAASMRPAGLRMALRTHQETGARANWFLLGTVSWQTYRSADTWTIGRLLGASDIGVFNMAKTLATLPLEKLVAVVTAITPAYLANATSDHGSLKRLFLTLIEGIALCVFPLLLALAINADHLIPTLLGDHWVDVITPLRILCFGASVWALSMIAGQVGSLSKSLRSISIAGAVAVPMSFIFYHFGTIHAGLVGASLGWVGVVLIVSLPSIVGACRVTASSPAELFIAIRPGLALSLAFACGAALVRLAEDRMSGLAFLILSYMSGGLAMTLVALRLESRLLSPLRAQLASWLRGKGLA